MKLVQYNTHHGGKRSDPLGTLDTQGFGDMLVKLAADVYCLNEVEQLDGYGNHDCVAIWVQKLRDAFPSYTWWGAFVNVSGVLNGSGQGNAIISRYPGSPALRLGMKGSRSAVASVLSTEIKPVLVVATHLEDEVATIRNVQMFQLLLWNTLSLAPTAIIAGDWNCKDGSVEQAPLQALYTDAWKQSVKDKTNSSYNGTGNTKSSRIDAVFVKNIGVQSAEVPDTRVNGVLVSDHSPLVVTFK